MKKVFWLLVLFNLGLFAVAQSGLLKDGKAVVAQPELKADKVRLLGQQAPEEKLAQPVSAPAVADAQPDSAAAVCMEWSDFSGADLKRASEALAPLALGGKLAQRPIEYNIGYWVYIPPLKDKAAINGKIAQLKSRGIEEYFVVQEAGEFQHAISLGVFKSEDAAKSFLESLAAKDVRSAKIGERASKLRATIFVFNGIDAQTAGKLGDLQKDFPASELKKVACR